MNPAQVTHQIKKTQDQAREILHSAEQDSDPANPVFALSNDEARARLTSTVGLAFDLRQTRNGLESELGILQQQVSLVKDLLGQVTVIGDQLTLVITSLMQNRPAE